jgi:hypothetical protein
MTKSGVTMTFEKIGLATLVSLGLVAFIYHQTGWYKIRDCYRMWFTKEYWEPLYNWVEAASWTAKAAVIIPGLIFGINIWQLYWITLATSLTLIWASNKKLLPTLVAFNSMWVWLSCMVIAQHLI